MSDSETIDPRRRIRELLAIPDRDRTDAEWDELNELEIRTAPGNRESASDRPAEKRSNHAAQPRRSAGAKGNGGQRSEARAPEARGEGRPAAKRQHRRPKRPAGQGGQGGPGSDSSGNS